MMEKVSAMPSTPADLTDEQQLLLVSQIARGICPTPVFLGFWDL